MIIKSFELKKINVKQNKLILFYGKNEGLKNEGINILIKDKSKISNYEEKEILDNEHDFIENILSKSLFEQEKFIVIKRSTDKILSIIETLHLKNLEDTTIILKILSVVLLITINFFCSKRDFDKIFSIKLISLSKISFSS